MKLVLDKNPAWRCVAPYTGVWIETLKNIISASPAPVAPYTGVWIETVTSWITEKDFLKSHLTQVCGLKREWDIKGSGSINVAPYTGVWIETPFTPPSKIR